MFNKIEDDDEIIQLNVDIFHVNCIEKWLKNVVINVQFVGKRSTVFLILLDNKKLI